jgi:cytosine/uracil/thiamine/allantoin permease
LVWCAKNIKNYSSILPLKASELLCFLVFWSLARIIKKVLQHTVFGANRLRLYVAASSMARCFTFVALLQKMHCRCILDLLTKNVSRRSLEFRKSVIFGGAVRDFFSATPRKKPAGLVLLAILLTRRVFLKHRWLNASV